MKSALAIFVKDLVIVHDEAKLLRSPVPLAGAALQQFISGEALGHGRRDDSNVVKVYEAVTGAPVAKRSPVGMVPGRKYGSEVGDWWVLEHTGKEEQIVEVGDEPRHHLVLQNEFVRVLRVQFAPDDTTLAHRHAEDSLYFFLVEKGLSVINHVQGSQPKCDCMDFGEVRFAPHGTDKALVHKITNKTTRTDMFCVDAELLRRPPVSSPLPLVAACHALVKTREKCRVYKFSLGPGAAAEISYPFYYLVVTLKGGTVKTSLKGNAMSWVETSKLGDVRWKEPCTDIVQTNTGLEVYEAYIVEWR